MDDAELEPIIKNMFIIMMSFHKKLLKMDSCESPDNFTRLHFAVMGTLSQGDITMSALAKTLMMPKPQLTRLVDSLVRLEIIERRLNETDRRVINLILTEKGKNILKEMKHKMQNNTKQLLSCLTPAELKRMSSALDTLQEILSKL